MDIEKVKEQAKQDGYNEAVKAAAHIVYIAGDDLAGLINDGESVSVSDCEDIIENCFLAISALKKGDG